ncbi:MAG: 3-oxoacyl-ACP synthase [Candidatus Edwardsbacteria bacterium RIFOXYD12_FULL_50_11]|uniref:Beta-ketoacyl-[acyl-carrier-protein] synthase III n=1 Tax=Candidatus Edwardsbacteria bacterium GWF2_54_11 TaxID=1817851 RepID=A0A1F5R2X6_9BACT|nr:MAG: 3-oxoacyl-ACP synthase [Candidatus Edwardsbacteria bacterium RifOxyC12_full_54_24]OGF06761.1 MAG: 3-oxoacyl-ACP synthase [Candidatus Edwardsbacteria bacterium RifOxyA12_full_54_48]OGF08828.1 MAG: 3-oxoacyl-ACP synthase [Candidatus Edwardsbacteria bacterium GWF2_54_11]OGF10711.1 MAG: 3-oxoacyl-ACP synthase [Candidatus Edwardsbacteria bacterium GWE2_54_12]OGF15494.1 MAG: 3-oxoacyl-ACP synthase [Candidatus Edwardsbacteria bacterium RIFOXYD12_FULL_50_11]OGJ18721.1 MAG: 3-oxoacyl-ACP syntha
MKYAAILGTGHFVPEKILTNADLEKIVETTDEWITQRSGIKERHISDEKTPTSKLCIEAARRALEAAGIKPEELDFIIIGTITPDMMFPSTACIVQAALGAKNAAAFDLSAGCTGFIYGLELARSLITADPRRKILVIGAEELTKITDWTDRGTCVLFGDGAGAAVLGAVDEDRGILGTYLGADGNLGDLLYMPGGGSLNPASHQTVDEKMHVVKMAGNKVFPHAVRNMLEASMKAMESAGITKDQLNLLIPHQANIRIIEAIAERLGAGADTVYVNIQKYGNTSAASIPIALDEAVREGRIKKGDLVMLVAFGAGFTWGAVLIRW